MKETIHLLEKVQKLDEEIYALKDRLSEIPSEKQELDRTLQSESAVFAEIERKLREVQLQQKKKEGDLSEKEGSVKKHEAQLAQVKTNKEYASLQSEIIAVKADNSLLEEDIIKLFDEIEAYQLKKKEEGERLKSLEKELNHKKSELDQEAGEAEKKLDILTAQKQDLIKQVDPKIASLYEKIVAKKEGIALAKVESETCPVCQLRLRPQQINEIAICKDIVLCEQCSRILYQ